MTTTEPINHAHSSTIGVDNQAPEDEKTYCTVHPTVETGLKCNRCGRYMCPKCAVLTPVGYRCRQCVYQQQDAFFKATQRDMLMAGLIAFVMSIPLSFLIPRTFVLGALLLSVPAGALIGEVIWRVIDKRKGRFMPHLVVAAILAGAVIGLLPTITQDILPLMRILETIGEVRGVDTSEILFGAFAPSVVYLVLCCVGAATRLR